MTLIEALEVNSKHPELQESLLDSGQSNPLDDFTASDPNDTIFREFDPPQYLESSPQAWKQSRPSFMTSLWECFRNVLVIQTIAGSLTGCVAVLLIFLDFSTVEWCYDDTIHWNNMPLDVQRLRVTAESIKCAIVQMWSFCSVILIFPFSLIKELHLITFNLLASFIDVIYRLNFQIYGVYKISWMSIPLNILYTIVVLVNNYLLARHFCPNSLKQAIKLNLIFSSQFLLGIPVTFIFVYELFSLYNEQDSQMKKIIFTGAFCPIVTVVPKIICRLGAQKLNGIVHPGASHVFVVVMYGCSAIVLRVLQAQLKSLDQFTILGLAHAIIDLLERTTITMRDHIWEHLYRLMRRQRRRQPKYRSPRSRRFIADVSIQIMMQESTALITALGFIDIYRYLYKEYKHNFRPIAHFLERAAVGLFIDLIFNTISLLIQTRVMNVAVNRVWKKKWRHHFLVNALLVFIAVCYYSGHLFEVVRSKYEHKHHPHVNCSYPNFW
ncbi:uncharacterized protein LOC116288990 [Actinia tenebrosa]|uniref:Uncharacterized protein LOC116288990 n=1 Tax=Actinia tenebrosa TaxID=6105 RepID=A0A6P8H914_ACTTE|nr:uncharacterized protein LOC116288990 [Actinia tenebrosa]